MYLIINSAVLNTRVHTNHIYFLASDSPSFSPSTSHLRPAGELLSTSVLLGPITSLWVVRGVQFYPTVLLYWLCLWLYMWIHVSICVFKAWIKGKFCNLFAFILFWTSDFLTYWALFQNILFCFPQRKGSVQVWNNMRVVIDDKWWWRNYDQQGWHTDPTEPLFVIVYCELAFGQT